MFNFLKKTRKKKTSIFSHSLMELIVVVMVIGILAGIAVPQFIRSRERAVDKEAVRILKAIHHAERMFRLENGTSYYPYNGEEGDVAHLDGNLSLMLPPELPDGNWYYCITGNSGAGYSARLTRSSGGFNRYWTINQAPTAEPTCSGNCP